MYCQCTKVWLVSNSALNINRKMEVSVMHVRTGSINSPRVTAVATPPTAATPTAATPTAQTQPAKQDALQKIVERFEGLFSVPKSYVYYTAEQRKKLSDGVEFRKQIQEFLNSVEESRYDRDFDTEIKDRIHKIVDEFTTKFILTEEQALDLKYMLNQFADEGSLHSSVPAATDFRFILRQYPDISLQVDAVLKEIKTTFHEKNRTPPKKFFTEDYSLSLAEELKAKEIEINPDALKSILEFVKSGFDRNPSPFIETNAQSLFEELSRQKKEIASTKEETLEILDSVLKVIKSDFNKQNMALYAQTYIRSQSQRISQDLLNEKGIKIDSSVIDAYFYEQRKIATQDFVQKGNPENEVETARKIRDGVLKDNSVHNHFSGCIADNTVKNPEAHKYFSEAIMEGRVPSEMAHENFAVAIQKDYASSQEAHENFSLAIKSGKVTNKKAHKHFSHAISAGTVTSTRAHENFAKSIFLGFVEKGCNLFAKAIASGKVKSANAHIDFAKAIDNGKVTTAVAHNDFARAIATGKVEIATEVAHNSFARAIEFGKVKSEIAHAQFAKAIATQKVRSELAHVHFAKAILNENVQNETAQALFASAIESGMVESEDVHKSFAQAIAAGTVTSGDAHKSFAQAIAAGKVTSHAAHAHFGSAILNNLVDSHEAHLLFARAIREESVTHESAVAAFKTAISNGKVSVQEDRYLDTLYAIERGQKTVAHDQAGLAKAILDGKVGERDQKVFAQAIFDGQVTSPLAHEYFAKAIFEGKVTDSTTHELFANVLVSGKVENKISQQYFVHAISNGKINVQALKNDLRFFSDLGKKFNIPTAILFGHFAETASSSSSQGLTESNSASSAAGDISSTEELADVVDFRTEITLLKEEDFAERVLRGKEISSGKIVEFSEKIKNGQVQSQEAIFLFAKALGSQAALSKVSGKAYENFALAILNGAVQNKWAIAAFLNIVKEHVNVNPVVRDQFFMSLFRTVLDHLNKEQKEILKSDSVYVENPALILKNAEFLLKRSIVQYAKDIKDGVVSNEDDILIFARFLAAENTLEVPDAYKHFVDAIPIMEQRADAKLIDTILAFSKTFFRESEKVRNPVVLNVGIISQWVAILENQKHHCEERLRAFSDATLRAILDRRPVAVRDERNEAYFTEKVAEIDTALSEVNKQFDVATKPTFIEPTYVQNQTAQKKWWQFWKK